MGTPIGQFPAIPEFTSTPNLTIEEFKKLHQDKWMKHYCIVGIGLRAEPQGKRHIALCLRDDQPIPKEVAQEILNNGFAYQTKVTGAWHNG